MILELFDRIPVEELSEILIVQNFDLLQLMGGTETVEEVLERDGALDGRQMGHGRHIHTLLNAGGSQLGKARLTTCHDVALVAEDGDGVRTDRTGGDMHDAGEHGARDAEHRRDHQHQALRCRKGGGQGAGLKRTVHGTAGAGFALQLYQLYRLTKEVLSPMGGPIVHMICHRARRRDRIDRGNFGKRIRDICGCLVAVHGFHDFFRAHSFLLVD